MMIDVFQQSTCLKCRTQFHPSYLKILLKSDFEAEVFERIDISEEFAVWDQNETDWSDDLEDKSASNRRHVIDPRNNGCQHLKMRSMVITAISSYILHASFICRYE